MKINACPQCGNIHKGPFAEGCSMSSWLIWTPMLGERPDDAEKIYGPDMFTAVEQWAEDTDQSNGYWISDEGGEAEVCVQIPSTRQIYTLRVVAETYINYTAGD